MDNQSEVVIEKKKKRLFNKKQKGEASTSAIVAFCSADFVMATVNDMINAYFIMFLTNFMMLPTVQITIMMLVTRVIDAFTDPMVGTFVDSTRSRWGKARPYLLFSPIPLAVLFFLMFTVPNFSMMGRLVYTYVIYIAFGIAQTCFSVPLMSLSLSMSSNPKERKNFYTLANFASTIGAAVPGIIPIIIQYKTDSHGAEENVYFYFALIVAVICCVLMFLPFFFMKEKVAPIIKKRPKIGKNIIELRKNRPLLCIMASSILASVRRMGYGAAIYFYKETLGNFALATFIGIFSSIPSYLIMAAVPLLANKFSPRNLIIAGYLYTASIFVMLFFVGYGSIFWVAFFMIISGAPSGMIRTCTQLIVADSVDYMEWRTGIRSEGLVFSMNSFTSKVNSALSGVWLPLGLTIIGYRTAVSAAELVIQSDATKQGLFYLFSLAPMLGSLMAGGMLFFDNFYGKRRETILESLRVKHEAAMAEIEEEKRLKKLKHMKLASAEAGVVSGAETTGNKDLDK